MAELFFFLVNTSIAIFVIVDPFAVIPIYLTLTERFEARERHTIIIRASVLAGIILVTFGISGQAIFRVFGITFPAFQIAGGVLLLLLGVNQLSANRTRVRNEEKMEGLERDDISIFPLATPMLAGPGAISTVVLYTSKTSTIPERTGLIMAIMVVVAASYLVLRIAPFLFRILGKTGLNVLTRLMGIILTAIAVQFIVDGIDKALISMKFFKP